jgi:hypothetical protein
MGHEGAVAEAMVPEGAFAEATSPEGFAAMIVE